MSEIKKRILGKSGIPGIKNQRQLEVNLTAGLLPPLSSTELAQISDIIEPAGGRMIWPASSTLD